MAPPYLCDLRDQVPRYHQIGDTWCGPTNIQMARNGYKNSGERKLYKQVDLVNAVKLNNTDEGWHCDPQGLRKTINALLNPPGVIWEESGEDDPRALLMKLLILMDRTRFPVPVLIGRGVHWVLLVEFETDVQPDSGVNVAIQRLGIHDSLKYGSSIFRPVSANDWFSDNDYWKRPIKYPTSQASGRWKGHYVGIAQTYVQPALMKAGMVSEKTKSGKLIVPKSPKVGRSITPAQAKSRALRWFRNSFYATDKKYLKMAKAPAGKPMLVRSLPDEKKTYFIVPIQGVQTKKEAGGTSMAILVGGADGTFKEAAMFDKPFRYLSRKQAIDIVRRALGPKRVAYKDHHLEAELVYRQSDISLSKTMPFWRVRLGKKAYYVDQGGELFVRIGTPAAGGN